MSDVQLIERAIKERRRVTLEYESVAGPRTIEPHALFISRTDKTCLDAFQLDGPTSKGKLPAWRQFDTAKIVRVHLLAERFELSPEFDAESPKYARGLLASA